MAGGGELACLSVGEIEESAETQKLEGKDGGVGATFFENYKLLNKKTLKSHKYKCDLEKFITFTGANFEEER